MGRAIRLSVVPGIINDDEDLVLLSRHFLYVFLNGHHLATTFGVAAVL